MKKLEFVHQFVPPTAPDSRTFLLFHGTGGGELDLIPLGRELDPNAALLSPRGKVLENGMPRFFRRLAEGIFDEEDVMRSANELADFVVAAASEYDFDVTRLTGVGYSNGANIAAAMILLHPQVLNSAILLRAMMPLSKPPVRPLTGKRVLLSAGDSDPIVPVFNVRSLATLLQERGADVELAIQHAGHALIAADLEVAKQWISS